MDTPVTAKEAFSFTKRAKSFTHAWRGLRILIQTTHNVWIHMGILILVILLGIHFSITLTEWMMLVFASGLVLITEAINTAIEIDINLTSPELHPYAKDTKDVAAGAVLLSALTASIIGVCIFGHYLF